jgi:DNA polymerase-1
MSRLVLIDGNAMLHRAYHALPPLTAPDGAVVNAVYGFGTMLLRLITDLKPTHVAVAFDRPKPTFRKKLFTGYQAKRPKMDEELVDQIPKVHDLIASFGIPIFEVDGFEADDVIGTLAKQSKDQVIIVTGDKDLLQLVKDDRILVYMPTKGLSQARLYDEKAVKERMGVVPNKIPDFKALAGDPSDNYPGVTGIGPKTAVALLTKYRTLKAILKTKELSATEKESARLCHDLSTIHTNVPLSGALTPLGSLNRPEAIAELTTLGFRSLIKRITGESKQDQQREQDQQDQKKKQKKIGEQQGLF